MRYVSTLKAALAASLALGCAETSSPANGPDTSVTPTPVPTESLTEADQVFQKKFGAVLAEAGSMDPTKLVALYPSPAKDAPLGFDPLAAAHLAEITATFELTTTQQAKLAQNGFVVLPASEPTPSMAYHAVYKAHLPLFITTDSMLHALHQSFDHVLKQLETASLMGTVDSLLTKTHAALLTVESPGPLAEVNADLDVYLAVARSLLTGTAVAPNDAQLTAQVTALLAKVDGLRLEQTELFGAARVMDFSQFEPRGHYTETEELKRYFKALMWLGRVDLRFREFDPETGTPIWRDRQIRASWLLREALNTSGARAHWESADALIGALMGEVDSLDFRGLDSFVEAAQLDATTVVGDLTQAHTVLEAGGFGRQRISSHYLATNPFSAEVTPQPIAFTLLGQRYVLDSHVMSNVVYDRIVTPEGAKPQRRLPSPLDALFVLGANHALTHLGGELEQWKYAGGLHAMRFLAEEHGPDFWENSVYNLWLSSLRALSAPPEGAPSTMGTAAWADKALYTTAASWAELRHDTILYAKQSYTGGAGCEYPDAYVEPYPDVYARLGKAAARLAAVVDTLPEADKAKMWVNVSDWAARWVDATGRLEAMARRQLAEEPWDASDESLVADWIAEESQGCVMGYTGIYPKLIADPEGITEADPTIADIHTNPNEDGPLAPAAVLHVGTGYTQLAVFTRQTCEGVRAYVGPVTSYYEVEEPGIERLTDEEWSDRLNTEQPALPTWTGSFVTE